MQTHNRKELKENRRNLRSNLTPAEIRLWKYLQSKQLEGRKFRRQHSIGNYIVDFYCPEERIAIELDGEVHLNPVNEQYDILRDNYIKSLGIKVIRFRNSDIFDRIDNVINEIKGCFK
ncbi:MAG: endonuclease domain-containing protein [Bacteroidales bacterium]|nr:MAG: endonuclease domain-containing protein [Bacteroidales bacterium]